MKLCELTGYKSASQKRFGDLINDLIISGKYTYEQGCFAVVLAPPGKDYVYRAWINDAGYEAFLQYIQAHPSYSFVEVIGTVRKIPMFFKRPAELKDDFIKVVRLEKLRELTSRTRAFVNFWALAIKPMHNSHLAKITFDDMLKRAMLFALNEDKQAMKEFCEQRKEFFSDLLEIAKWLRSNDKVAYDINGDNVMMRYNGSLAITDPAFSRSGRGIITAPELAALDHEYAAVQGRSRQR
jgi:hypothetical protein